MDDLIDANCKLATAIREQARRDRKPGSGVVVRHTSIKAVNSGQGVVVQTVRSNKTGELLANEVLSLGEVEANGFPVPDMLNLRSPSARPSQAVAMARLADAASDPLEIVDRQ